MFGNYGPYGFSGPFGGPFNSPMTAQSAQQGLFGQPMPQPTPAPAVQQTGPSAAPAVLYVPNVSDVKEVDLHGAANALIIVQNEPVIAMKTAVNSMGLTATDYYHLDKFDPSAVLVPTPLPSQDFVTRAEFQRFVDSLRAPIAEQPAAVEPVEFQTKKEAAKK